MSPGEIIVVCWQTLLALTGLVVGRFQIVALQRVPMRETLPPWQASAAQFGAFSGISAFCLLGVGIACSFAMNTLFPGFIATKADVVYLIPPTQTLSLITLILFIKFVPGSFPKALSTESAFRKTTKKRFSPSRLFGAPAFFTVGFFLSTLATLAVSAAILLAPESVREIFRENQVLVDAFRDAKSPVVVALCVPAIALLTPIIEEIIFRAGLYRFLKSKMRAVPAALLSSFIFALMHDAPISYLPLTLLGCVFCLSYEKTGSLAVPITVHGLFNANTLLCLAFL